MTPPRLRLLCNPKTETSVSKVTNGMGLPFGASCPSMLPPVLSIIAEMKALGPTKFIKKKNKLRGHTNCAYLNRMHGKAAVMVMMAAASAQAFSPPALGRIGLSLVVQKQVACACVLASID